MSTDFLLQDRPYFPNKGLICIPWGDRRERRSVYSWVTSSSSHLDYIHMWGVSVLNNMDWGFAFFSLLHCLHCCAKLPLLVCPAKLAYYSPNLVLQPSKSTSRSSWYCLFIQILHPPSASKGLPPSASLTFHSASILCHCLQLRGCNARFPRGQLLACYYLFGIFPINSSTLLLNMAAINYLKKREPFISSVWNMTVWIF